MKVELFSAYSTLRKSMLHPRNVVVVDMMRTAPAIVAALANGAKQIIPVSDVSEAIEIARRYDKKTTLLAGVRDNVKLADFDLGCSAQEFTRDAVSGKTIVLSTSYGAAALEYVSQAKSVTVGALSNRRALCEYLVKKYKAVTLVCTGESERPAAEDIYACGALIASLRGLLGGAEKPDLQIDDACLVAEVFYRAAKTDGELLKSVRQFMSLRTAGRAKDVTHCLKEDVLAVIPVMQSGVLVAAP